jgi:hypothetical protein
MLAKWAINLPQFPLETVPPKFTPHSRCRRHALFHHVPCEGAVRWGRFQGLKPLAESWCPFGVRAGSNFQSCEASGGDRTRRQAHSRFSSKAPLPLEHFLCARRFHLGTISALSSVFLIKDVLVSQCSHYRCNSVTQSAVRNVLCFQQFRFSDWHGKKNSLVLTNVQWSSEATWRPVANRESVGGAWRLHRRG